MTAWPSFDVTISLFSQSVQKYYNNFACARFYFERIGAFIEAKAVALIYCLIKKNDIFHLSEMRKQELHSPPPYIGEVSRSDGGVRKYRQWR